MTNRNKARSVLIGGTGIIYHVPPKERLKTKFGGDKMKLRTENGIRSFLIRIAEKCSEQNCLDCPFVKEEGKCGFSCVLDDPATWNVNDIMERYKNIE